MHLAVKSRRVRTRIFYVPWFTILCTSDMIIMGFLCIMASVFFFFHCTPYCWQHTFQHVCGRLVISFSEMEQHAHRTCTTSPSSSKVVPVWLSVLAKMSSQWQIVEISEQFSLINEWPISAIVTCMDIFPILERRPCLVLYIYTLILRRWKHSKSSILDQQTNNIPFKRTKRNTFVSKLELSYCFS